MLGYVGIDNVGLSGLEATYDNLVRGRAGTVLVQTDARRTAFSRVERPPTAGAALELTIDEFLQHVAERELRAGVQSSGASGGSAIVMDPYTGEILALANAPDFNPNAYRDAREEVRRNRATQDLYEPGSTFKIVTASAAFEERAATPATIIDASAGNIRFGTRVIRDDHNYGVLSFADVIVRSSNVGAIKVALKLGPEKVSDYVRRFGFGKPTSPDFRGESPGIVWDPARLNDSALASVAMGYQVGVTPLQMAAAVSAVANGGELVQPRAVRAVIRDGKRLPVPRKVITRPITADTAATLTQIMEDVVDRGTGERAQITGYTVAGKTGTAKKLVNGSYRGHSDYNVSFVGFVPSRKPVFAIVVVVDSPHRVSPYGGVVAAPIFQKIAATALRHYAVPPSINAPDAVVCGSPQREIRAAGVGPEYAATDRSARRIPVCRCHGVPGPHGHERARRAPRARAAWADRAPAGYRRRGAAIPAGGRTDRIRLHRRAQARARVALREREQSHDRRRTPPRARPGARTGPISGARRRCARHALHRRRPRLPAGREGRGVRGAARPESQRRDLRAAGHRRGRLGNRGGGAAVHRCERAVDCRQRRAPGARLAVRRILRTPQPRDASDRHHRHQRQDDDGLPRQRDARCRGHPVRPDGDGDVSDRRPRLRRHANDARSAGSPGLHAGHGDRGLRCLRDGSVVARAGAEARGRHPVRRGGFHQPDARSPRLPCRHGGLLRRQAPPVRVAPR